MNIQAALDSIKILSVVPEYDFDSLSSGRFNLQITTNGVMRPHTLRYVVFLEWLFKQDPGLYDYIRNRFENKDETLSHVVEELYDIGFDVDYSVKEYFEYVKANVDQVLLARVIGYMGLHDFGEDSQD